MDLIENQQQFCFKLLEILKDNQSLAESADQLYEKISNLLGIMDVSGDILQPMKVILDEINDLDPDAQALVDCRAKVDTLIAQQLAGVQEGQDIEMDCDY